MKTIPLKCRAPQPMKHICILSPHSQENLFLVAIALTTTVATLGTLFCLFDQTQCVRVSTTGNLETLHGFKDCAPPHLR